MRKDIEKKKGGIAVISSAHGTVEGSSFVGPWGWVVCISRRVAFFSDERIVRSSKSFMLYILSSS